jgi:hypothetical protein
MEHQIELSYQVVATTTPYKDNAPLLKESAQERNHHQE